MGGCLCQCICTYKIKNVACEMMYNFSVQLCQWLSSVVIPYKCQCPRSFAHPC
ncbi:hypothetical protein GALMADRAFT_1291836 [Galerina marginata CBS 339.88]|uniref:Uncharacterized protein n=1 Tax=Galerina marginata (strain CBS 339.88) TaxID=685588 RepID=A0A067S3N5_GALM3|nr:hypothetical protein GALMADRAFT_1291836 [Galerina marginata CBS 339.88]